MNVLIHATKRKLLLVAMMAALIVASVFSLGQVANASEGVTSAHGTSSTTVIDPNNVEDGTYYIDYTVLYANEEKTSMTTQYLVSPALLKVKDNKKTVSFTVLQSKEIVGLKLSGNDGIVSNVDDANNKRVVTFDIDQLADIQPGWISINWIVEAINFKYIKEYDIRFKFLPESIIAVAEDAPVPTKDGKVGFPSGLNEDSIDSGSETDDAQAGNEAEQEEQQTQNASFTDIEGHWAKAVIEQAVQAEVADGYSDGTFKPDAVVTRAQFAVMLSRALKLPEANAASSFADGDKLPAWASKPIDSVVAAGLMGGYSDETFRGSNNISRTEIAVIIARAAGLDLKKDGALSFADASSIPTWAKKEVAAAVQAGLINGKANNRFEPAASATRAEALTLLMRLLNTTK